MAVTLTGGGEFIGVAPLGTAFTDAQAEFLRPYLGDGRAQIIVATDNDPAGRRAAEQAFWKLAARGAEPRHLMITGSNDPAELLQTCGPAALRAALAQSGSLAGSLIAEHLTQHVDRIDTVEGNLAAARATASIIGALPPTSWTGHIDRVDAELNLMPGALALHVVEAGETWTEHGLASPPPQPSRPLPTRRSPIRPAAERWHDTVHHIDPRITNSVDWPKLADALDRAAASGYNVEQALPELARREPLPQCEPARVLYDRLSQDCPPAATPRLAQVRPRTAAAHSVDHVRATVGAREEAHRTRAR
jgi:DNA primase